MTKLTLKSMAAGGALALALFAFGQGRRNSAPDKTSQSDTFEEIDAHIERQMERLNIPGVALAIVEDDEIAHLRGFGQARPGGEEPTPHTPFIIGSARRRLSRTPAPFPTSSPTWRSCRSKTKAWYCS